MSVYKRCYETSTYIRLLTGNFIWLREFFLNPTWTINTAVRSILKTAEPLKINFYNAVYIKYVYGCVDSICIRFPYSRWRYSLVYTSCTFVYHERIYCEKILICYSLLESLSLVGRAVPLSLLNVPSGPQQKNEREALIHVCLCNKWQRIWRHRNRHEHVRGTLSSWELSMEIPGTYRLFVWFFQYFIDICVRNPVYTCTLFGVSGYEPSITLTRGDVPNVLGCYYFFLFLRRNSDEKSATLIYPSSKKNH